MQMCRPIHKALWTALLCWFLYCPHEPPDVQPRLIVDECAPGYTANPPTFNPPCVRIVQPHYRGQR